MKTKYYVVWKGIKPGIYNNWEACKIQIEGFKGAMYKAFDTITLAKAAFATSPLQFIGNNKKLPEGINADALAIIGKPILNSICVDAACSGNPGDMEYRGVIFESGKEFFNMGPFKEGTNNIGEFLAIVRAIAMLKQLKNNAIIYSDSKIAISWVKAKQCKTKLVQTAKNAIIFDMIAKAEQWLTENTYTTIIKKWETKAWGENPADFGRK